MRLMFEFLLMLSFAGLEVWVPMELQGGSAADREGRESLHVIINMQRVVDIGLLPTLSTAGSEFWLPAQLLITQ